MGTNLLPGISWHENQVTKKILVVAAHPDDEVLGCGGVIARHVAMGHDVHTVFMSNGVSSRTNASATDIEHRLKALKKAQCILGISSTVCFDFPDNQMDAVPLLAIVQKLEHTIEIIKPLIVYTHHHGDLNIDHRLTHQAVMTACRPVPGSSVREIYSFEIVSSTEWATSYSTLFMPNVFVDITDHLKVKLAALEAYSSELRKIPHSRSIEHVATLAKHRGYCVGLEAAEGFMLTRVIVSD